MGDGANVVMQGFGSLTMLTEGFGYTPVFDSVSAKGSIRNETLDFINAGALLKVRNELARAFAAMRTQYGEGVTIGAIWAAVDDIILAQPGIYKKVLNSEFV